MIRSIAIFQNYCALNSKPVLSAVRTSAHKRGIEILDDSRDADALLIWSVLWAGRMAPNQLLYQHYRALQRPVIVIDVGALRRNHTWKIALNHITAEGRYGHKSNLDWDRPNKLGVKLENSVGGDRILIACQHSGSLQMEQWPNTESWINSVIESVKQNSDRPIVVRPHPRSRIDARLINYKIDLEYPNRIKNTYDDFDLMMNWHAVVNHTSGPGIHAAMANVRPVVHHTSLAAPVGCNFANIEDAYTADREKWFVELCHTEYTVPEIEQGRWIERLFDEQD